MNMAVYFDDKRKSWYCKFRYTDWTGESKSTSKRGFKLKREAIAYEAEYKEKAKDRPQMKLKQLADAFLEDYKINRKPASYSMAEKNLRLYILPQLGQMDIGDITPMVIKKWQNSLTKLNQSDSSIKAYNTTFNTLLNWGVKFYGLKNNPFKIVGTTGKVAKRDVFIEEKEWSEIDNDITDVFDKAALNLLFWSGMRIGELRALQPGDVDFEKCTIRINKTYSEAYGIGKPKTANGERVIKIPEQTMNHLNTLFNSFYELPDFPFRQRCLITIKTHLKEYCEKHYKFNIHPHCLRHSHATLLVRMNVPLPAIAKRLGDKIETVMSTYAHCYNSQEDEIADMLTKLQ